MADVVQLVTEREAMRTEPGRGRFVLLVPVHLGAAWQGLVGPAGGPVHVTTGSRRDGPEGAAAFTL